MCFCCFCGIVSVCRVMSEMSRLGNCSPPESILIPILSSSLDSSLTIKFSGGLAIPGHNVDYLWAPRMLGGVQVVVCGRSGFYAKFLPLGGKFVFLGAIE